ncbi:type I-D CRISPR-associated protein Cas5/Csc1 [Thermoflavimicrobium daqui]|uniref:Type I-D CRISPR-associated protein Cas5/Csc1 n=1 Tax=Thermoflavimicrobium daqui TaxID=2137476 RepID=A0A364K775_9BACL|nr:type I-D CRISPR-associated protein Cas5/Csc1 [Thermoflavimicrobium daqui]
MTLEDYLFFASMEKGRVAETAPLIHNYALAFALGWTSSPYYHEKQVPQYPSQLDPLNSKGLYIFPAMATKYTSRLMQYNTLDETWTLVKKKSIGYPNWGFIKCLSPGSKFYTYVLSADPIHFPNQIRLGKWMSSVSLQLKEVSLQKSMCKQCDHTMNVKDLPHLPVYFTSLYNILPTRVIQGMVWDEEIQGYRIGEEQVFLPEAAFWWRD